MEIVRDTGAIRVWSVCCLFSDIVYKTENILDGYTTADIDYFWGSDRRKQSQVVGFEPLSLPQFKAIGYQVNVTRAITSSGAAFFRNTHLTVNVFLFICPKFTAVKVLYVKSVFCHICSWN